MRRVFYRAALRLLPAGQAALVYPELALAPEQSKKLRAILRRHRARSAELRLFDLSGQVHSALYQGAGEPLQPDTSFRLASISKMVTALAVMKLAEQGRIEIDRDVNEWLPFALRHPQAPEAPVTLRQLMSHTAGLQDGGDYTQALSSGRPVDQVLAGDSWRQVPPGHSWQYSNLGAGLVASVLEAALDEPFEGIMQGTLFAPLGIAASFYPQRIASPLAGAWRVLPPDQRPSFDPAERRQRSLAGADEPMPMQHYTLAQGNCCASAAGVQALMRCLMTPGFLSQQSIDSMLAPQATFGARAPMMRQGLGIFRLDDPAIFPGTLYGHQGNAYGAVHAAFFEPLSGRGLVFLSTGAALSRRAFLCDVVEGLLAFGFSEATWQRT